MDKRQKHIFFCWKQNKKKKKERHENDVPSKFRQSIKFRGMPRDYFEIPWWIYLWQPIKGPFIWDCTGNGGKRIPGWIFSFVYKMLFNKWGSWGICLKLFFIEYGPIFRHLMNFIKFLFFTVIRDQWKWCHIIEIFY